MKISYSILTIYVWGVDLRLYEYLKNKLILKESFVRAWRFYCSRGDAINQYVDELSVKIFSLQ